MKRNLTNWQKYVRTFRGRIYEMYHKMQSRIRRGDCITPVSYEGKFLLARKKFRTKAFRSKKLKRLYKSWVRKDYQQSFVPTVDRINSKIGYKLGNIRFLSLSENIRSGARKRGRHKS